MHKLSPNEVHARPLVIIQVLSALTVSQFPYIIQSLSRKQALWIASAFLPLTD